MSTDSDTRSTHFGYQTVDVEEKAAKVRGVFDSVAGNYDLMNDLMSGGIHRIWKRFTVDKANVRPGQQVLDLAGGTGDLAAEFAKALGNQGIFGNLNIAQVDAEALPFADNSFDLITIAFGLRNVTRKEVALRSMLRVLKPGGRLLVLEFSKPHEMLKPAYDLFSFSVLPTLGKLIANDAESYRYLAESIRMHPDQETLKAMMEAAGFERVAFDNLTGGIAALHSGYKL